MSKRCHSEHRGCVVEGSLEGTKRQGGLVQVEGSGEECEAFQTESTAKAGVLQKGRPEPLQG